MSTTHSLSWMASTSAACPATISSIRCLSPAATPRHAQLCSDGVCNDMRCFVSCRAHLCPSVQLKDGERSTYPVGVLLENAADFTLSQKPNYVITLAPSCPSALNGLHLGDSIISVNNSGVLHMTPFELMTQLDKATEHGPVTARVTRFGLHSAFNFDCCHLNFCSYFQIPRRAQHRMPFKLSEIQSKSRSCLLLLARLLPSPVSVTTPRRLQTAFGSATRYHC